MPFILELSVFSHHDDGDIIEKHALYSDPNAENVTLFRDRVAEAFEMGGYLLETRDDFEYYFRTPSDQETYAVGLRVFPTLFNEEPEARTLSLTLSSLARFDLGERDTPKYSRPAEKRVLLLHALFENPPVLRTPLAVGSPQDVQRQRERVEKLLEGLGFRHAQVSCEHDMHAGMQLEHRTVFFTDEPLVANLGSTDVQLTRGLLAATALHNLSEFRNNPRGLQALLACGLIQWD